MFTLTVIRRVVIGFVALLTLLAFGAAPAVAGSSAAGGSALAFTSIGTDSGPTVLRAAAALGVPAKSLTAKPTRAQAGGSRVRLAAVTCLVSGSAPHIAGGTGSTAQINTSVLVSCDGEINEITISIWLLSSFDNESFTTSANRLNERSRFSPFGVGATTSQGLCLPQYWVGLAYIWVKFKDGTPLEDGGWFGTESVYLTCG
jgi:hypothetical protein